MKTEEEYNAEVLQLMRDLYPTLKGEEKERAERLFPELKESEDERIRKSLIDMLKNDEKCYLKEIAWCEKQGENKPADTERLLQAEYKKGWDEALHQLPQEVDSQIWQIACHSAKTWEESFAILNATQKAYDKGKKDALTEQKPAWSEADEEMLDNIIDDYDDVEEHNLCDDIGKVMWLKSLKERVQPKVELTQLDKNILEAAIAFVEQNNHFNCWRGVDKHTVLSALYSLRPQNTWKPSDGQMKQLSWVAEQNKDNALGKELMSLYQDLKKLREE